MNWLKKTLFLKYDKLKLVLLTNRCVETNNYIKASNTNFKQQDHGAVIGSMSNSH